ncbi:hypothetical protein OSTOST_22868 [Ostertagia ostertagi]
MTSLSSQLQSLRTATAQHQTVERRHVSLLFAKKEAEALDRETVYNIGCVGLRKLKELDGEFAAKNDLFDESRLHFQRSMITNEENLALNEKIEKLLFLLSPYLQHFACQQIYAYNAESMILTFLPFHETNVFGRILSILEYNFATSKDWAFLEGFGKKEYPVPFSSSALPSFRQASLMVICQLAVTVKLTPDVVASLTKVVLMKASEQFTGKLAVNSNCFMPTTISGVPVNQSSSKNVAQ